MQDVNRGNSTNVAGNPTRGLAALLLSIALVAGLTVLGLRRQAIRQAAASAALAKADGPVIKLELDKYITLELVRIPAGKFLMGSPDAEADRDASSESPQHQVIVPRDLYVGKVEVTQAQWQAVMGNNQASVKGDPNLPEESVSWGDCQKFCDAVSARTGRKVRLPSEAEWEYACRAGTATATAFGDTLSGNQANFNGQSPYNGAPATPVRGKILPVGSFKPNAFGLYDMHGNVSEWCQDIFHNDYTDAPSDSSSWNIGGNDPKIRVFRGGAYNNDGSNCRSAIRFANDQDTRTSTVGFRVVCEVLPK